MAAEPGDRYTEATAGYDWLRRHGVPDQAILKEVKGRDTWESLAAVSRFLAPRGVKDVIPGVRPHALACGSTRHRGRRSGLAPARVAAAASCTTLHPAAGARTMGRETVAVGLGRIIGYRRLSRLVG